MKRDVKTSGFHHNFLRRMHHGIYIKLPASLTFDEYNIEMSQPGLNL